MNLFENLRTQSKLQKNVIEFKEYRIFYQYSGLQPGVTPILFLHGWGISTEPYNHILNLFAQQHPIIAVDLPGFAQSSYSNFIPDYETYAKLLVNFIEALGLESVHLVGHSLGGGISIVLANLIPQKISSIVLVDSTGAPELSIPEVAVRRAIEMTAQMSISNFDLQLYEIPKVFSNNLLFNTGNVLQALLISLVKSLRHYMPTIAAPCLLLWSEKDLTTPLSAAHEMATLIPNARLKIVEEGYHEWALWYPEEFTAIVLEFVRSPR